MIVVPKNNLEFFFSDFTAFLKEAKGETFKSFSCSKFMINEENYKYQVPSEAKAHLDQKHWKESDIGTGKIQERVNSSIQDKLHYNFQWHKNNLIDWRKKDDFAKKIVNEKLEQTLFDFFKNKIDNKEAFETLLKTKLSYQFIAYLFFVKEMKLFLPITQKRFDEVFKLIGLTDFKTSGNASWENYMIFIDINKQVQEFLKTKDPHTTLIDAHSFLYILGSQMKEAKYPFSMLKENSINERLDVNIDNLENEVSAFQDFAIVNEDDEETFPEGKESFRLHKYKERDKEVVRLAKERHLKNDERLCCQVCYFSFKETYGELGLGYIEAHHVFPISELKHETMTKIDDLVLVCSNCHRMLHRRRPWLDIGRLSNLLKKR